MFRGDRNSDRQPHLCAGLRSRPGEPCGDPAVLLGGSASTLQSPRGLRLGFGR